MVAGRNHSSGEILGTDPPPPGRPRPRGPLEIFKIPGLQGDSGSGVPFAGGIRSPAPSMPNPCSISLLSPVPTAVRRISASWTPSNPQNRPSPRGFQLRKTLPQADSVSCSSSLLSSTWALRAGTGRFRDLQPYSEGRVRHERMQTTNARVGTVGTPRGCGEEGGRDTPRWRRVRTENGNPSSTRLTPSRKLTRPGLLRHRNMQQAATGHILTRRPHAKSFPGGEPLIVRGCSRPHHPALPDRTSLGVSRQVLGRKLCNCDGGCRSTRRCNWDVVSPEALLPSSGTGCHLPFSQLQNQTSASQSPPTDAQLPNIGSDDSLGELGRGNGRREPVPLGSIRQTPISPGGVFPWAPVSTEEGGVFWGPFPGKETSKKTSKKTGKNMGRN